MGTSSARSFQNTANGDKLGESHVAIVFLQPFRPREEKFAFKIKEVDVFSRELPARSADFFKVVLPDTTLLEL